VIGITSLLAWFGFIAVFEHFDATRPTKADAKVGRVIPQNNHGHIVYLTEQEEKNKQDLQYIAFGLFLATTVAAYFHKKASSRTDTAG
jgi:hypothetical protein